MLNSKTGHAPEKSPFVRGGGGGQDFFLLSNNYEELMFYTVLDDRILRIRSTQKPKSQKPQSQKPVEL